MRKPGLRSRFILANLVVVITLHLSLTAISMHLFESYEANSLKKQLVVDLERLDLLMQHPAHPDELDFGNSKGLIVATKNLYQLPDSLQQMPVGVHEDVVINGRENFVGRKQSGDNHLFVLLDAQQFEEMELRMLRYAIVSFVAGIAVAILLSLWMSRQVLRPVIDLSAWVSGCMPGQPRVPFLKKYGDADIDSMAHTFESHLARIEEFVARERALTEDVSHELRTPLAVIKSALTLLLEGDDLSVQSRQRVERIHRATTQMAELTEAILYLAREDGGGGDGMVLLNETIMAVVDSRQEVAARAGATITLSFHGTQSVTAHPGMVSSIIGNVLDNAISHGGGGEIVIDLVPGRITVTDQGPGIPADHVDLIFDRKIRMGGSRGYGLGLHIVRSLCDRLGWQISISSAAPAGACVSIEFPVSR